jgi:hypothetical protein
MNPTRGIVGCCARAGSGNVAAVPPRRVMNCRRLKCALYKEKPTIGGCIVHHGKIIPSTSETGPRTDSAVPD